MGMSWKHDMDGFVYGSPTNPARTGIEHLTKRKRAHKLVLPADSRERADHLHLQAFPQSHLTPFFLLLLPLPFTWEHDLKGKSFVEESFGEAKTQTN